MSTRIKTPHAAILVWNYVDRLGAMDANHAQANKVQEEIISTVSCVNIQTAKTKGEPAGTFSFTLAPTRNWTSVLTVGSWCVMMMSNDPLTKESFERADPRLVKMVGKIESVRVQVSTDHTGARQTQYLVSGQDWGHIFTNVLYIDPLISDPKDSKDEQGNALYQYLTNMLVKNGSPSFGPVIRNLWALLSIAGEPIKIPEATRLAKATHTWLMPSQMSKFFNFVNPKGKPTAETRILKSIKIQGGKLQDKEGNYVYASDGGGWVDPYTLIGAHTLWQVLMDNGNPALNEMFNEISWLPNGPQLTLFNRIKPFAFRKKPVPGSATSLRSQFKYIPTHHLDSNLVSTVSAGVNWQDKYNFVEIKPDISDLSILDVWIKQKSQAWASVDVFNREGFRPLLFGIHQLPGNLDKTTDSFTLDINELNAWAYLLTELYFDTHRTLNGQIVMTGSSEYIAVGNNIMFDAGLVGVTPNYNAASAKHPDCFVLAHVQSVKHTFSVDGDGSRRFQTVVEFVRGVFVDKNKNPIGEGFLDTLSTAMSPEASENSATVISSVGPDNGLPKG